MISSDVSTTHCPKCHDQRLDEAVECVRCGIIFAKYRPLPKREGKMVTGYFWDATVRDGTDKQGIHLDQELSRLDWEE